MSNIKFTNPFAKTKKPDVPSNAKSPSLWMTAKIINVTLDGITVEDARGEYRVNIENIGEVTVKPWQCVIKLGKAFKNKYWDTLRQLAEGERRSFSVVCFPGQNNDVEYGAKYISEVKKEEEGDEPDEDEEDDVEEILEEIE